MNTILKNLFLMGVLLISGCASILDARTDRIGERRVEYALAGKSAPAVVFESGLGGTMDWWAKVFPEVAKETMVFAYNRPGYGESERAVTPRDGDHVVDELRALLKSRNLTPPYVLVGHSLGGLYMQLFARRHPDEVAALVLVDSTHPEQFKGAGARENWPAWARVGFGLLLSETAETELNAMDATGVAVLSLPPLEGKPVFVLSKLEPMQEKSALTIDANEKRKDIVRLHPGAKQIWVDSGHAIPLEKPEAVIQAIREALRESRFAQMPPPAVPVE
ncbi:MAG: alpha/beta hydrolase [Hydrogenophilales bacterium 32-62-9]|nr:MAG: alpha/beta hydrolase [Hydrogenophilales bacterium 32-62-9]